MKAHHNPLVESVADLYHKMYSDVYMPFTLTLMDVSKIAEQIPDKGISIEDAVDLGFLCRELEGLFDECRKEAKARHEKIARLVGTVLINKMLTDPNVEDNDILARGIYASGTPKASVTPTMPRRETQEYMDLCEFFGIDPELAKKGLVVWHYPQFAEYCTELASEGRPLPPGVDGSATKITTVFRRLTHGKTKKDNRRS